MGVTSAATSSLYGRSSLQHISQIIEWACSTISLLVYMYEPLTLSPSVYA